MKSYFFFLCANFFSGAARAGRAWCFLGLVAVLAGLMACEQPVAREGAPSFALRLGEVALTAEVADSVEEMTQGLMHRVELAPDHGMLFVYADAGRRSFWMKNTHIPLDLGFFTADGILREIHPLVPNDLTSVSSRRSDIVYALEMNRGWFAAKGVVPGARMDPEMLRQALEAARQSP